MSHYNKDYINWQQELGRIAATGNLFMYNAYINSEYNVVDFGCGGGFLLNNLKCKGKLGIEINENARKLASLNKINTVGDSKDIPDEWADVIISSHALEHTFNPLNELKMLHSKLKRGGRVVFVVPYERKNAYKPNDINQHLFTWSEMNLGNLFTLAGYRVQEVKEIRHRFPPGSRKLVKLLGNKLFHIASLVWGNLRTNITQVRIVAEKV